MNKFILDVYYSAHKDMNEIVDYYKQYSSIGAKRIRSKMRKAIRNIYAQPYMGAKVINDELTGLELRKVVIENYLMFYKVFEEENKIVIYRVVDGRRDYPSLLQ